MRSDEWIKHFGSLRPPVLKDDDKVDVRYGRVKDGPINYNMYAGRCSWEIITQWRFAQETGEMAAPADKPPGSADQPSDGILAGVIEEVPIYGVGIGHRIHGALGVHETLNERGSMYGDFAENARIAQHLKQVLMHDGQDIREGWRRLSLTQREGLENIMQKVARILNGDPNYADNWHDIQGYARLVEERLPNGQKS